MVNKNEFYYDEQLRKYIVQFAAIFMGLQVEVGKRGSVDAHLVPVPIKVASADRVVAAIKDENTQNKLLRLPLCSCQLIGIELAPELRKGVMQSRRNTYMPTNGVFPDDLKVVEQRMPVPYKAEMELTLYASNQDQHYQMVEQILSIFDPVFQIQLTDEAFDWTRVTTVELTNINFDENFTPGGDRRIIQTTLSFTMPIHLSLPNRVHQRFIKEIYLRIGAVATDAANSFDIIADLNSQQIPYEHVFSLDDVDIT